MWGRVGETFEAGDTPVIASWHPRRDTGGAASGESPLVARQAALPFRGRRAPVCGLSKLVNCISRESNPGHIDGNDVFYH